jgi:ATP-dependent helicase HrpA
MLIEAGKSPVRGDVLIIASALAIQDPRERPLDREKEADQEHAKFRKNDSDFLTVLQIWKHFDEHYDRWSQSQMRKFCRVHFLSYQRLREWREIHDQILRILDDVGESPTSPTAHPTEPDEDQIHRCILSGLLGNVAVREDGNQFLATRGRKVMVYPGSVLFRRQERSSQSKNQPPGAKRPRDKKEWIVAAELVETSRLFARTVCRVDPGWISTLASHLINYSHQEPHWSDKAQRVLVWRREFLYGLMIRESRVGYSTIEPEAAKECFIREGIQERSIRDQFAFLTHNQRIEDEVESLQTRLRRSVAFDITGRIFQFYHERLPMIASVAELHPWWRSLEPKQRQAMLLQVEDLLDQSVDEAQQRAFPESVDLGGEPGKIEYRYTPGKEEDGATLTVPLSQFLAVQQGSLDWMVPGYVLEKVEQLLKTLPKDFRTHLTPIKDHAEKLVRLIKPSPASLVADLSEAIRVHYNLKIPMDAWDLSSLPAHLKLKVRLVDDKSGEILTQSSDWQQLKSQADQAIASRGLAPSQSFRLKAWNDAVARWEKPDVQDWVFDDLPEELVIGAFHGIPLHAYPGLAMTKDGRVHVRLFDRKDEARRLTPTAYRRLCEVGLGREMVWFEKDLRLIKPALLPFADLYAWDAFAGDIQRMVMHSLFLDGLSWPITKTQFRSDLANAIQRMRTLPIALRDLLLGIGEQRLALMRSNNAPHPSVAATLQRLLPAHFIRIYTIAQLQQVPRYLKALALRMERAVTNPIKDSEKAARIDPILKEYAALCKTLTSRTREQEIAIRNLFFLLEELRVSVFAQDLGTNVKVSEKIIRDQIKGIQEGGGRNVH